MFKQNEEVLKSLFNTFFRDSSSKYVQDFRNFKSVEIKLGLLKRNKFGVSNIDRRMVFNLLPKDFETAFQNNLFPF